MLQSAGNLATSQAIITLLRQRIQQQERAQFTYRKTMYEAADLVGHTLRVR